MNGQAEICSPRTICRSKYAHTNISARSSCRLAALLMLHLPDTSPLMVFTKPTKVHKSIQSMSAKDFHKIII